MSYILDALRKSESERRQGRIPDLGSSVQMVHKRRRKSIHWSVWLTLALLINAGVFGVIFWPGHPGSASKASQGIKVGGQAVTVPSVEPVKLNPQPQNLAGKALPASAAKPEKLSAQQAGVQKSAAEKPPVTAASQTVATATGSHANRSPSSPIQVPKGATLIRPHQAPVPVGQNGGGSGSNVSTNAPEQGSVPELSDMPESFQRQVPDLHFNGHIYSSDPGARRVMINNVYLGEGDSYKGLRIDRITPHGVVMTLNGRAFRVGVVQDWNSPN